MYSLPQCTLPIGPESEVAGRDMRDLSVHRLSYCADGKSIVRDVSFELTGGGITALMGANGAGKSVLLRLLHGLAPASGGDILWGGLPAEAAKGVQAMVFQSPVLLRRSVIANIQFALRATGRHRTDATDILNAVGLVHKAKQSARSLSGGEAQRLALARALATEPRVLFLDEATASLDPASARAIEDIVDRTSRQNGVRVVMVTHDLGQARRMADDVLFLNNGTLEEHTPMDRFVSAPSSRAAQAFVEGRFLD